MAKPKRTSASVKVEALRALLKMREDGKPVRDDDKRMEWAEFDPIPEKNWHPNCVSTTEHRVLDAVQKAGTGSTIAIETVRSQIGNWSDVCVRITSIYGKGKAAVPFKALPQKLRELVDKPEKWEVALKEAGYVVKEEGLKLPTLGGTGVRSRKNGFASGLDSFENML